MTIRQFIHLLVLLLLAACAQKKPQAKDNRTGHAKLIGVVEMVNPEQSYVLINCDRKSTLKSGTELIALDHTGAKSRLVVTPERKGNYLTADIKEGSPITGALVLQKIKESDTLPAAPRVGGESTATAASTPDLSVMPGERPPPIPEIVFPSQGGGTGPLPSLQPVPVPTLNKDEPAPPQSDLSKLPPVIR